MINGDDYDDDQRVSESHVSDHVACSHLAARSSQCGGA